MSKINVLLDSRTYVTNPKNPNDSWDRDDTDTENSVRGIELVKNDSYSDLAVPFEVIPGKNYWLVWAEYSTADSFGRDGGNVEIIDLFTDYEKARACAERAEKAEESPCAQSFSFRYIREDGSELQQHCPWIGYFERLEMVHTELVFCTSVKR